MRVRVCVCVGFPIIWAQMGKFAPNTYSLKESELYGCYFHESAMRRAGGWISIIDWSGWTFQHSKHLGSVSRVPKQILAHYAGNIQLVVHVRMPSALRNIQQVTPHQDRTNCHSLPLLSYNR